MNRLSLVALVFIFIIAIVSPAIAGNEQVIAGAGPSTKIVELFVEEFSAQTIVSNYSFIVPPKSSKHAGGIRNSDLHLFGRTGRPLNNKELSMSKEEISLARLPIAFVVGKKTGIKKLTINQVEDIFSGKITNWKELGGADKDIYTLGRESTEALFTVLKKNYPAFEHAKFDRIFTKDHFIVKFFLQPKGDYAISFGAKPNFDSKDINQLEVDDFSIGVSVGLVYDLKNSDHELIRAAKTFAKSTQWVKAIEAMGLLAPM